MKTRKWGASGVRRYWKERARRYGLSYQASWTDLPMIEMEIRQVLRYLDDGDRVLDIGCGNGYSTVRLARDRDLTVRGLDPVSEMVRSAQKRIKRERALARRVSFAAGDITALKDPAGTYDKVVAVRVFINLMNAGLRRKAFTECARVLKKRGRLIVSDATVEGWRNLNAFRREWELAEIPMPPFNDYLKEKEFVRQASVHFRLVETQPFSSTYFVGTRVLKPLLLRLLKKAKNPADPLTHWNRWFSCLPAWGDHGTQKIFVFEKK